MTDSGGPHQPYTIRPAKYRPPEAGPQPRHKTPPRAKPAPPAPPAAPPRAATPRTARQPRGPGPGPSHPRFWLLPIAAVLASALVIGLVWSGSSLRSVELNITPPPDRVSVSGPALHFGSRLWVSPGDHRLHAERQGYAPLDEPLHIPAAGPVHLAFAMQPLPGRLEITSDPAGAEVRIGEDLAGVTPLADVRLAAGSHELHFTADGYQPLQRTVQIEGFDKTQQLTVTLLPQAPVHFSTQPAGADITIGGRVLGQTPATVGLDAGRQEVSLSLAGYQPWSGEIEVTGSEAQTVPEVTLKKAPAGIRIKSTPSGASVVIGGRTQGKTPLTAALEPEVRTEIILTHPGYHDLRNVVTVPADAVEDLEVTLTPIRGEVAIAAEPADAHLIVGGRDLGPASRVFRLPAVKTDLLFRKPGYRDETRTVTPHPNRRVELKVKLESEREARLERLPEWLESGDGQRLRLIRPGRFTMGAPRGQQGRRANEIERQVELVRPFYLADREVTNARFRAFRRNHSSGIAGKVTLDNEQQPVVRIGWEDAAAYCNWLSARDGLTAAYRATNGRLELIRPVPNGYRLPSEAEWAYAARFAAGRDLKYPWGASLPPPAGSGNFADRSAAGLLPAVLSDYDDGWAASAPVGTFKADALGLYDIGGNVTEWIGDVYDGGLIAAPALERDPLGPQGGGAHVVRGSSWRHAGLGEMRLSWRDQAGEGRDDLGFRIARYAE